MGWAWGALLMFSSLILVCVVWFITLSLYCYSPDDDDF